MTRPRYPTKADWAAAQAERLRAEARALTAAAVPATAWHRVRAKVAAIDALRRESLRFDTMAARFRARGL